jgi:(S)-3,5-dihydroxyphenylglycine transaminase
MVDGVTAVDVTDLHASLTAPAVGSMRFLNEVADWYPEAVSFAAGAPHEDLFEVESITRYLETYQAYLRDERGLSPREVRRTLFQYGRTKGCIQDLVAKHLELDEGVVVDPESIVVTVGCHEAIYLVLRALRRDEKDVLLAVAPTYMGLTSIALLVDMPVVPVASGAAGIDLVDLVDRIREVRGRGDRVRACYVMPDFANPAGVSMSQAVREQLLRIAHEEDILLLEDNPYGLFADDGPRARTLKAQDVTRQVVYLGSFAKSGLPGARVGYVVADQPVTGDGGTGLLADELAKIKGSLTVNTSPIAQAVIGGKLLENGCNLAKANLAEAEVYRCNRKLLLDGLASRFPAGCGVTWNKPRGGFFVVVEVPFEVDDDAVRLSARDFGVLWTPLRYFYGGTEAVNRIRLSYSLLTPDEVELGLDRFAAFVHDRRS